MERTRSLPLTKEEGRERAAAAAGPLPLSLGSAAAEGFGKNRPGARASPEPAPPPSWRSYPGRSPPGRTEGSGQRELYSRLQNWPEPETAAASAQA